MARLQQESFSTTASRLDLMTLSLSAAALSWSSLPAPQARARRRQPALEPAVLERQAS